jgi:hypothetical protein
MKILLFLAGLLLSGTAAYYSVLGLIAIFSGAVIPIIVMGGSLEFAKVVTASYLYRHWKQISFSMKAYMSAAVVTLVLLTSMGIFGFLSKAHLEHAASTGADVTAAVAEIQADVDIDKKIVADADKQLEMLDGTVKNYNTIRRQQQMRKEILVEKKAAMQRLRENNRKLAAANLEVKKVEVEVGPLKYIAELFYGKENATTHLDSAVRGVIMMLIFVFDPLAILLLISASTTFAAKVEEKKEEIIVEEKVEEQPKEEEIEVKQPQSNSSVVLDDDDDSIVLEVTSDNKEDVDVVKISRKDILEMIKNGEK